MFGFLFSRNYQVRFLKFSRELEPQEILLDRLALQQEENGLEQKRIEVPLSKTVARAIFLLLLVGLGVFLERTFHFQIAEHRALSALAEQNMIRTVPIFAERGVMYDHSMRQLVFNRSGFDLICDKRDMPSDREGLERNLRLLSKILERPFDELKANFGETSAPFFLAQEKLSHEQRIIWEAKKNEVSGCEVRETIVREYAGNAFAHLLGYVSSISVQELREKPGYFVGENIGKMGVESSYEDVLRGEPGEILIEKDAMGNVLSEGKAKDPRSGNNAVLWLRSELQQKAQNALQNVFEKTGTKKGAVVAMDPRNGGVLALVSLPTFDNNIFTKGMAAQEWEQLQRDPSAPLFNRAISGIGYPTGSVIKPLVGLAALQEGIINEKKIIYAPLELCIWNKYSQQDECFRDWTYHGDSDIKRAIAESINTFFYIIGGGYGDIEGLGAQKIKEYIQEFGWGSKTGIDIPGEGAGILPNLEKDWRLGNTYHFSIGQGPFSITPVQVAAAFGAIANGGTLYQPRVVERIIDKEKNTVREIQPVIIRDHLSDASYLETIRKGMRQTVTAGSATNWLNELPVKVAAKTGTAQTGRKTSDGKDYLYNWTVAFAPYENPEIVVVAVVENARENQAVALPVVKDILEEYFR